MSASSLLTLLFSDLSEGFIEIRTLSAKRSPRQLFCRSVAEAEDHVRKIQEAEVGTNIYFGVCLRKERKGNKNAILSVSCLWADLDAKDFTRGKEEILERLEAFPIKPSILVDSGNGYHAYWLLKEAEVIQDSADVTRVEQYLKTLASHLNADPAAAELARILRVPETTNWKYPENPIAVRLVHLDSDRQSNLSDFDSFLPIEKAEPSIVSKSANWVADGLANLTPEKNRHITFRSIVGLLHRDGLPESAIKALLLPHARDCDFSEELLRLVDDICTRYPGRDDESKNPTILQPQSLLKLLEVYPRLREPVIDGLLREGETMNVIAHPKIGKSLLVNGLALSIATGTPWLGMNCAQGNVLIIDNELHPETAADRLRKLVAKMNLDANGIGDRIQMISLRGRLIDLLKLGSHLREIPPGQFKVVILDAFYRFLPVATDENDNGALAGLYNDIDSYAEHLKSSFVLIHHSSKGNQASKSITDVGAGAGAQSRAADTHLILRAHKEEGIVVLDAVTRSWQQMNPFCLRKDYPLWIRDDNFDPKDLRKEGRASRGNEHKDSAKSKPDDLSETEFAKRFVTEDGRNKNRILEEAKRAGISKARAISLLDLAEESGLIHKWIVAGGRQGYATKPQPKPTSEDSERPAGKRAAILALLELRTDLKVAEVAKQCEVTPEYVRRIRRKSMGEFHVK